MSNKLLIKRKTCRL